MQRRYFILAATALAACGASGPVTLPPDSTLILTRHGDRSGSEDLLNDRGRQRARDLVTALDGVALAVRGEQELGRAVKERGLAVREERERAALEAGPRSWRGHA